MPPELCLRTPGCAIRAWGRLGQRAGPDPAGRGGLAAPPLRARLRPAPRRGAAAPPADPRPLAGVGPLRAQPRRFWLERWDPPGSSWCFEGAPLEFREKGGCVTKAQITHSGSVPPSKGRLAYHILLDSFIPKPLRRRLEWVTLCFPRFRLGPFKAPGAFIA